MHRSHRRGFLQKSIYTLFGYYPWECFGCRKTWMFKKKFERRKTRGSKEAHDTTAV